MNALKWAIPVKLGESNISKSCETALTTTNTQTYSESV